ncbi:MAG: thioredoxin [Clostridia bacterium]|nr:thioredoxin [Clostridia bacterium]
MKEVILFKLASCPHCKLALKLQEELFAAHPEWREIPLRVVDEAVEKAFADSYDYYYVPTYYVDGKKVHEGHAEKSDVEKVFRAALGEKAAK